MRDTTVLIGTCGWQYPQWDTTYYPEGLPEDWQLAYYGNEYPVVMIPAAYWMQGRDVIDSWLQETAERPSFICEWVFSSNGPGQTELHDGIAALGDRVEGILVTLNTIPDAGQLATINTLATSYAVSVDWPGIEYAQIRAVIDQTDQANRVGVCWDGEAGTVSRLQCGRMALARVPSAGQSPRSLRSLLETLMANAEGRPAVLLFDGDPPDLEIVDQAEVILNLL